MMLFILSVGAEPLTCADCVHDNGRRGEHAQCKAGERPNDSEPVCGSFEPRA